MKGQTMLTIESPRELIEAEVERLIGLLDQMDGDPDLEALEVDEDGDPGEHDARRFPSTPAGSLGHEFFTA